jgi:thymidylate synthase
MASGFSLLTTKKMPLQVIATELLWFLQGRTDLRYLLENDCNIWTGDAFKNYLNTYKGNFEMDREEFIEAIKTNPEFTEKWGELGPIYGKQWRKWHTGWDVVEDNSREAGVRRIEYGIDQIANLINDLKTNPDSRRLMVNAWNVGELDSMVLPPCHYGFQVYTRELKLGERIELLRKKEDSIWLNTGLVESVIEPMLTEHNIPTRAISLMWNQRSVDTFLGLPFNIASYGLLLEIVAKIVNMVPDELIGNLGDTHLYLNHIEQAKEQIGRELSLEERKEIYEKEYTDGMKVQNDEWLESKLKTRDIPTRTREPYPLPTLKHMKTDEFYKALSEDTSLFTHIDPTDFQVENYQSHPKIVAPLSN